MWRRKEKTENKVLSFFFVFSFLRILIRLCNSTTTVPQKLHSVQEIKSNRRGTQLPGSHRRWAKMPEKKNNDNIQQVF